VEVAVWVMCLFLVLRLLSSRGEVARNAGEALP
jgi:hypothetical protein